MAGQSEARRRRQEEMRAAQQRAAASAGASYKAKKSIPSVQKPSGGRWSGVVDVALETRDKNRAKRNAQVAADRRHVQQGMRYQANDEPSMRALMRYYGKGGDDSTPEEVEAFTARYNQHGAEQAEADGYVRDDAKVKRYFEAVQGDISKNTPLHGDLRKLEEGDYDRIRRWNRMLPTLVSLYESGEAEARKAAGSIMAAHFTSLEPHLNAMDPEWTKRFREEGRHEYAPKPKGPIGLFAAALDRLNDPLQGALHGIAALDQKGLTSGEAWKYAGSSALRGLVSGANFGTSLGTDWNTRIANAAGLDFDPNVEFADRRMGQENIGRLAGRDGYMTLREALDTDFEGPGVPTPFGRLDVGGVMDFGAEVLLDPLSLVTMGSGAKAKAGLQAALRRVSVEGFEGMEKGAARAMVEEAVETIRWGGGWKKVSPEAQDMIRVLIRDEAAEASLRASERVLRTQKARNKIAQSVMKHNDKTEDIRESWAERMAKRQLDAIKSRGRVGVGLAGHNVVPLPRIPGLAGRWDTKVLQRTLPTVTEGLARSSVQDVPSNIGFADDWVLGYDVSDAANARIKNAEKAYADVTQAPEMIEHAYIQTALRGGNPMEYLAPLAEQARLHGDDVDFYIKELDEELRGGLLRHMVQGSVLPKDELAGVRAALTGDDVELSDRIIRGFLDNPDELEQIVASAVFHGENFERTLGAIRPRLEEFAGMFGHGEVLDRLDNMLYEARLIEASRAAFKGGNKRTIAKPFTTASKEHAEALRKTQFRPASPRVALAGDVDTKSDFLGRFAKTTPRQVEKLRVRSDIYTDPTRTVVTRTPGKSVPWIESVLNNLQPRRRVRTGSLGPGVAEALGELTTKARAARDTGVHDKTRQTLGRLTERAAKEADKLNIAQLDVGGQVARRLAEADTGGKRMKVIENVLLGNNAQDLAAVQLRTALEKSGAKTILRVTDVMRQVREEVTDISRRAGVPEESLRADYLPRVKNPTAVAKITDELRKRPGGGDLLPQEHKVLAALGLTWDQTSKRLTHTGLSSKLTHEGRLEARKFAPEVEDLMDLNERAASLLKTVDIDVRDLFLDDPHTAVMLRANTAYKAQMQTDILQWAAGTVDNAGRPLAYIARTPEDRRRLRLTLEADTHAEVPFSKLRELDYPGGGKVYVHPELADELENTWRLLSDPSVEGKLAAFLDEWNNVWASWATVGSVATLGVGFHARNALGNTLNMVLAGMTNPKYLRDAQRLQSIAARAYKMMEDGATWDEAVESLKVAPRDRIILNDVRERGFSQGGRVADMFAGNKAYGDEAKISRQARKAGLSEPKRSLRRFALDKAQDNALLRKSRDLGTAVEENAKIALYLDGLDRGLSPSAATERVHKFLFDYNDLTSFEAKLRRVSRFYTFTRKNAQLYAGLLLTRPGAIAVSARVADRWAQMFASGDRLERREPGLQEDGTIVPDWAVDSHRYSETTQTLIDVDTPLGNFAEMYGSVWGLAGSLPMLPYDTLAPEHQKHYDLQERMRNFTSVFAGGPVTAVTWVAENLTGVDTYTGFKLKNEPMDQLMNFLDMIAPIAARTEKGWEGWIEVGKSQLQGHEDANRILSLRMMNALGGMNVIDLKDPERAQRAMDGLIGEVERTLYDHRDAFIEEHGEEAWEAISLDNLREAGKVERRNWVAEIMLLHPKEEWPERFIKAGIPMSTIRRLGLALPSGWTEEKAEERDHEWYQNRVGDILNLLDAYNESMGLPPLTEQERLNVTMLNAGVTMTGLEELGIEPWRENQHLRDSKGRRTNEQQGQEAYDRLVALGYSPEQLAQQQPVLSWADRFIQDSREAGWTEEEIQSYIIDDLSREGRAVLQNMGVPVDNDEYSYRRLTQEQIEKRKKEAANIDAKLDFIFQAFFQRPPTPEERFTYHYQTYLTKGEQKLLGLPKGPKVPSRKNVASAAEKRLDAQAKAALSAGAPVDASQFPTNDERRAWEARVNGR